MPPLTCRPSLLVLFLSRPAKAFSSVVFLQGGTTMAAAQACNRGGQQQTGAQERSWRGPHQAWRQRHGRRPACKGWCDKRPSSLQPRFMEGLPCCTHPLPGGPSSSVRRPGLSTPVTPLSMVRWCLLDLWMPADVRRSCNSKQAIVRGTERSEEHVDCDHDAAALQAPCTSPSCCAPQTAVASPEAC